MTFIYTKSIIFVFDFVYYYYYCSIKCNIKVGLFVEEHHPLTSIKHSKNERKLQIMINL